ncbi:glycosyltransferase [Ideonella sp.]|uniref:glycosyltransferase n=1 Tax=Ideonella sp. TaxID=1929293 RepID=UPI002B493C7A|nr:glycosyltransferase [Ideonella sp.]HJV71255.1 glycosyltransferase [Ideonella sp.]
MFSPLPPAKSGIADYACELLPALSAIRPVLVVCERAPQAPPGGNCQVITLEDYERDSSLAALPHVYQIGNNADHVFAYRAFKRRPGVLVQHDFNLHYLVEDATLAAGDAEGYRDVLCEEYGDAGGTLADMRQIGLFSESQKLALPLNTHLLHRASGLIVHSQWVHDRLPAEVHGRTLVVPHHFAPQATEFDALTPAQARESLGLRQDTFVVLSLGYITPPKQIQATLAALAMLRRRGARFVFVIGGQRNPGFDIDAHIRRHGLEECVRVTGYLDETAFFHHIVAADVLVNLRYPTVGESSGTLARALALGLPAIVHNFGPLAELPDDVVLKVPLELGEPTALAAALEGLMLYPDWRARLGQAARRHMRVHCSVEQSAAMYSQLLDGLGKGLSSGHGAGGRIGPHGPQLVAA